MGNVNKLIEESPDETLVCRIMRHTYDIRTSTVERKGRKIHCTQACERCGVERTQHLNYNGRITGSSYVYPNGYKVDGVGTLDGADLGVLRVYVFTEVLARS